MFVCLHGNELLASVGLSHKRETPQRNGRCLPPSLLWFQNWLGLADSFIVNLKIIQLREWWNSKIWLNENQSFGICVLQCLVTCFSTSYGLSLGHQLVYISSTFLPVFLTHAEIGNVRNLNSCQIWLKQGNSCVRHGKASGAVIRINFISCLKRCKVWEQWIYSRMIALFQLCLNSF